MANYAYLRVSTDQQDLDNQRHGILEYANQQGISKRSIAKLLDCSKSTLYNWLEREGLNKKKPPSKDKQETT